MDWKKTAILLVLMLVVIFRHFEKLKSKGNYKKKWMPFLQDLSETVFGSQGSLITQSFDPDQWKTDKKSVLLILFGLPIGAFLIFGIIFAFMYFSS